VKVLAAPIPAEKKENPTTVDNANLPAKLNASAAAAESISD
jgi:hypothetical protein